MVHRTTETDWKSLYEAETRISARQAAEIVQLRSLNESARHTAIEDCAAPRLDRQITPSGFSNSWGHHASGIANSCEQNEGA